MDAQPVRAALLLVSLLASPVARGEDQPPAQKPREDRPKIELGGYLQIDYRRGDPGELSAPAHELNGRRARLGVSGRLDERISYAVSVQGDGLNANSASILDASATLKLSSWAKLQAGQFKYDFDLQGRESASLLAFSDRPWSTQVVAGGLNGASSPSSPSSSSRDRGLSFSATPRSGRVQGSFGLFQGSGRASDNNSAFSPVLRVQAVPAKGWLLSGGFFHSDTVDSGNSGPGSFRGWTLGASFESGGTWVRAEYYGARRERSGTHREEVSGAYLHGIRSLGKKFELLLRLQALEDPAVLADGTLRSVDFGGRYFLVRQGARGGTSLLVNVLLRDAPDGSLKGVTVLNDGRGAAVTRAADLGPVLVARLQVQF